jgi:hypothetical protein
MANKRKLATKDNLRKKQIDIDNGIKVRRNSITLVSNIVSLLDAQTIKTYKGFISIIQSLQPGPMTRASNGVLLELAIKNLLLSLCPKKLKNKENSVIRVDELTSSAAETSVYDLLIDFSIWKKSQVTEMLAIDMLMATNRFNSYMDASKFFEEMSNSEECYFPIQVKKNSGFNSDLMTDKPGGTLSAVLKKLSDRKNFSMMQLWADVLLHLGYVYTTSKVNLKAPVEISGLFFNSFHFKNTNLSVLEVLPMPDVQDMNTSYYNKFQVFDGNKRIKEAMFSEVIDHSMDLMVKLESFLAIRTDVSFILNRKACRYHISNRAGKNEMFALKVENELERRTITEAEFANSAMTYLTDKYIT